MGHSGYFLWHTQQDCQRYLYGEVLRMLKTDHNMIYEEDLNALEPKWGKHII